MTLQEASNTITDTSSSGAGADSGPQHKEDLQYYCMNWIWRAVECLVQTPEFNPSPKWISQRLGITVEKAVDAMEGLERLGLIVRVGNSFKTSTPQYDIGTKDLTKDKLLEIHSRIAPQIISKLDANCKFSSGFLVADEHLVMEYVPKIQKILVEMQEEGLRRGLREVYATEYSFTGLTRSNSSGGKS